MNDLSKIKRTCFIYMFPNINRSVRQIKTFVTALFLTVCSFAQTNIALQADNGKEKISKHIYGHFAEHLGHCIYDIDAAKAQDISIDIRGTKYGGIAGKILASSKLQDYNSFEMPDKIKPAVFKNFKQADGKISATLPPFSVVVLEIK